MSYSDYYELRKQQEDEYEESLRLDQEKEKKTLEKHIEDEDEPELTIEELRLARLKALDKNYVEEKPKVKNKRKLVKVVKVLKPRKKSTK